MAGAAANDRSRPRRRRVRSRCLLDSRPRWRNPARTVRARVWWIFGVTTAAVAVACADVTGLSDLVVVSVQERDDSPASATPDGEDEDSTRGAPKKDAHSDGASTSEPGDGGAKPDARRAKPSGVVGIKCGDQLVCSAPSQCCFGGEGEAGACRTTDCGEDTGSYACDDPADCSGQACCAIAVFGIVLGTGCLSACNGSALVCVGDGDCPSGQTCALAGSTSPPTLRTCR